MGGGAAPQGRTAASGPMLDGDGEPVRWPRRGSTTSRKVGAPQGRVLVRARTG